MQPHNDNSDQITQLIHRSSHPRGYPSSEFFRSEFDHSDYCDSIATTNSAGRSLGLILQLPLSSPIATDNCCAPLSNQREEQADAYLHLLQQELALKGALIGQQRNVNQLYLSGGIVSGLGARRLRQLLTSISQHFRLLPPERAEYQIEASPDEINRFNIKLLCQLGFYQLSLKLDNASPAAHQQLQQTVELARDHRLDAITLKIRYGLPGQSYPQFVASLDSLPQLKPDRIQLSSFRYQPHNCINHRQIDPDTLPSGQTLQKMFKTAATHLQQAGYQSIAPNLFCSEQDPLLLAKRQGRLQHNMQGYTRQVPGDLLGFGPGAISAISHHYYQNSCEMAHYTAQLQRAELPVQSGLQLNRQERLRQSIIDELLCNNRLHLPIFERIYRCQFKQEFAQEWQALQQLAAEGVVEIRNNTIQLMDDLLAVTKVSGLFDRFQSSAL